MLKNTYWLKLRFQPSTLLSSNKRTTDSKFQSYDVIGGKKFRRLRFRCTGIHSYELVLLKEVRWFQLYCNLKYQLWFFFSVPIIPEFLYSIRHQHDHFTTPRIRITTTTTTTPQTPFGFNETFYGDPAAPLDFIGNTEREIFLNFLPHFQILF